MPARPPSDAPPGTAPEPSRRASRALIAVQLLATGAVIWTPAYAALERVLFTWPIGIAGAAAAVHGLATTTSPRRVVAVVVGTLLLAYALRIVGDGFVDASRHNLWPFGMAVLAVPAAALALVAALAGRALRRRR